MPSWMSCGWHTQQGARRDDEQAEACRDGHGHPAFLPGQLIRRARAARRARRSHGHGVSHLRARGSGHHHPAERLRDADGARRRRKLLGGLRRGGTPRRRLRVSHLHARRRSRRPLRSLWLRHGAEARPQVDHPRHEHPCVPRPGLDGSQNAAHRRGAQHLRAACGLVAQAQGWRGRPRQGRRRVTHRRPSRLVRLRRACRPSHRPPLEERLQLRGVHAARGAPRRPELGLPGHGLLLPHQSLRNCRPAQDPRRPVAPGWHRRHSRLRPRALCHGRLRAP